MKVQCLLAVRIQDMVLITFYHFCHQCPVPIHEALLTHQYTSCGSNGINNLIGQTRCNSNVNFFHYQGKTGFEVEINFNSNSILVALFIIHYRSLFSSIKIKKTTPWSYDNSLRSFVAALLKRYVFRLYW